MCTVTPPGLMPDHIFVVGGVFLVLKPKADFCFPYSICPSLSNWAVRFRGLQPGTAIQTHEAFD